ncbi:alpha/beta fold hydrolase [Candidatus Sumerlaeota bacterium]|nr:alpha/beta fold hydrolase [Candidatus Sumerlaeota bacterium]
MKRVQLREHRKADAAPKASAGPVVVLIHGLNVPHLVMWPLRWRLRYRYRRRVEIFRYERFHHDVPQLAELLARRLAKQGIKEFDAITHSMGGIVLRWAMNHQPMPKLRRAIMIAPPNNGAWMAEYLSKKLGLFFRWIFGQGGLQMRPGKLGLAARAGLLDGAEVGIIAGGNGTAKGKRNWFGIPGDCDGTVAVEETILPGMKDFILLDYNHSHILFAAQTAMMANLFLEHGVFRPKLKKSH